MDWGEFAKILKISERNLSDWKREKITLPLSTVKIICKKADLALPKNVQLLLPYWYTKKGASKGGLAVLEKYKTIGGDPKIRMKRWQEWWEKEGKFKKQPILDRFPIKKPLFSAKLAEFVGILLGDGGISQRQVSITLNRETDKEYIKFVKKMIKELFGISPGLYSHLKSKADTIVISRTELVEYLTQRLGLKTGNKVKQRIDIPKWIMRKRKYKIACLRGLVDTDGTTIIHRYKSKNRFYVYKKLGFTSRSFPLLKSVNGILTELKIKNRIAKDQYDIRIEAVADIKKYFDLIGSSNPKHLKRYLTGL
ncbi:MAG: LAGLIDADG family homing endonuclease [Parcubacteria group bacterium]